jgi:hypothetical protein
VLELNANSVAATEPIRKLVERTISFSRSSD